MSTVAWAWEGTLFKKILLAGLATSALAIGAPVAHAAAVNADCGFSTIAQEDVTGGQDTFTGVAYGYAATDIPGATVSVSCEVRVNGGPAASTPAGPAGQVSATAGQVTYTAAETDTVTLCAVWVGANGETSGEICGPTTTQQIPPQEVIDLINSVLDLIAEITRPTDAVICQAITTAGVPALVNTAYATSGLYVDYGDCDVSYNGVRLLDLDPYHDAYGPYN